jgi:hypothetical protein
VVFYLFFFSFRIFQRGEVGEDLGISLFGISPSRVFRVGRWARTWVIVLLLVFFLEWGGGRGPG